MQLLADFCSRDLLHQADLSKVTPVCEYEWVLEIVVADGGIHNYDMGRHSHVRVQSEILQPSHYYTAVYEVVCELDISEIDQNLTMLLVIAAIAGVVASTGWSTWGISPVRWSAFCCSLQGVIIGT